jgi:hypothetical protein
MADTALGNRPDGQSPGPGGSCSWALLLPPRDETATSMRNDTPVTLAVAIYDGREAAVVDFRDVMAAKSLIGEFDHIA